MKNLFSFKYMRGDLFRLILFTAVIKSFFSNHISYAIFWVLLMIWKELHEFNQEINLKRDKK